MTEIEATLRQLVKSVGSQASAARVLQISRSHLNHLLKGRKEFGPDLAKRLGFRRIVEFQRVRVKWPRESK